MATDADAARLGLLRFLAKKGGSLPMRELHTHSLVFYQAGHQAFSQLMEGLVGDGLVTYDQASAVFTLTERGGRQSVGRRACGRRHFDGPLPLVAACCQVRQAAGEGRVMAHGVQSDIDGNKQQRAVVGHIVMTGRRLLAVLLLALTVGCGESSMPVGVPPAGGSADADWYREAVFYQVWVRSYADSDGDGIGDLRGVDGVLPLGQLASMALPGESYKLAFSPGLLERIYQRPLDLVQPPGAPPPETLLPHPDAVLPVDIVAGQVADRGGYLDSQTLRAANLFPANPAHPLWTVSDADGHWWIPSGQVFYRRETGNAPAELSFARQHFFLPHRFKDPFGQNTLVSYDMHDLLLLETEDALSNKVTAGERDDRGNITSKLDYRVLQPARHRPQSQPVGGQVRRPGYAGWHGGDGKTRREQRGFARQLRAGPGSRPSCSPTFRIRSPTPGQSWEQRPPG